MEKGGRTLFNPLRLIGLSEGPNLLLLLISRERPFEFLKFLLFLKSLFFNLLDSVSFFDLKNHEISTFFLFCWLSANRNLENRVEIMIQHIKEPIYAKIFKKIREFLSFRGNLVLQRDQLTGTQYFNLSAPG